MPRIDDRLKDFVEASRGMFWQRQATFAGATLLAAYYVDLSLALICYGICQISELYDERIIRRIVDWDGRDQAVGVDFLAQLTMSAVLSSVAVVQYIVVIALAEGPSLHLGPLFFLFAAALYAAMNNCQVPRVLITRMAIYSAVLLFIPIHDLWVVRPPLHSDLWKQFGVVLFVLYFLIECSRKFLENYEVRMSQIEDMQYERDRVAEAYMVQSRFVSIVSHELRTPLTTIKASLDLITCLQLGDLPEDIRKVAEIGRKSSNRLATLIDDLLDFQKLRSGNMSFRFVRVDLVQLVQDSVEANQSLGASRGVTVRLQSTTVPVSIKGDVGRLMQVMTNVLSNAIKFSHEGGVVDVALDVTDGQVRIAISDHGIGIPDDAHDIVFQPFKQADTSDKREFGGTGLGMSIAKQIVEGHGGWIDFTSRLEEGTTFVIELDVLPEAEILETEETEALDTELLSALASDAGLPAPLPPERRPSFRQVVTRLLSPAAT